VLVAAVGGAEGSLGTAAALACACADAEVATLLVDVGGRAPRPTLIATAAAREMEERLRAHLPGARLAARGQVCHLSVAADPAGLDTASAAAAAAVRDGTATVRLPPGLLRRALVREEIGPRPSGVLLRADLSSDRALVGLAVRDLLERDLAVGVMKHRLGWVAERRALFGALPAGSPGGLPERLVRRLRGGRR
ncbi:MAG TPA: hypothetical protein VNR67_04335, partial [Solirubrobacterales bacterium]|nr:hypothetical protein [Solirubrobacterales bacterium]